MADRPQGSTDDAGVGAQPATVTAALTQVLAGTELAPDPQCAGCRRGLLGGMAVTVYAYRRADAAWWDVPRVSCGACARTAIPEPTRGSAEAPVTGELTQRGVVLTLTPTAVIDWAGPDEGRAPGEAAP